MEGGELCLVKLDLGLLFSFDSFLQAVSALGSTELLRDLGYSISFQFIGVSYLIISVSIYNSINLVSCIAPVFDALKQYC